MGCIVLNGRIHTWNSPNYCDYNATHSYANSSHNSSRLKSRRCELTLRKVKISLRFSVNFQMLCTEKDDFCYCSSSRSMKLGQCNISLILSLISIHQHYSTLSTANIETRNLLVTMAADSVWQCKAGLCGVLVWC